MALLEVDKDDVDTCGEGRMPLVGVTVGGVIGVVGRPEDPLVTHETNCSRHQTQIHIIDRVS